MNFCGFPCFPRAANRFCRVTVVYDSQTVPRCFISFWREDAVMRGLCPGKRSAQTPRIAPTWSFIGRTRPVPDSVLLRPTVSVHELEKVLQTELDQPGRHRGLGNHAKV